MVGTALRNDRSGSSIDRYRLMVGVEKRRVVTACTLVTLLHALIWVCMVSHNATTTRAPDHTIAVNGHYYRHPARSRRVQKSH